MTLIKNMPPSEKPREKAIALGVEALSTRELLAIILRVGTRGESALSVADALLIHSSGIAGLEKMSFDELCEVRGISKVKAVQLKATLELSKRALCEMAYQDDVIRSPDHLIQWLQRELGPCEQEKFMVIYLDNSHRIITYRVLFIGTVNMSHIYPRDVLREALQKNAVSMILVHNHPSGNLEPGESDLRATLLMLKTANMMGIQIDDHIIVSQNSYFSFVSEGIMCELIESLNRK